MHFCDVGQSTSNHVLRRQCNRRTHGCWRRVVSLRVEHSSREQKAVCSAVIDKESEWDLHIRNNGSTHYTSQQPKQVQISKAARHKVLRQQMLFFMHTDVRYTRLQAQWRRLSVLEKKLFQEELLSLQPPPFPPGKK